MRVVIQNEYKEQSLDGYFPDEIFTLENFAKLDASSLESIDCLDILDYQIERDSILQLILSKLRYSGRVTFVGTDLTAVCLEILNQKINTQQAFNALYGGKMSTVAISEMVVLLQQYGLKILNARLQNDQYFVSAERIIKN
jgi:hypothetical protein